LILSHVLKLLFRVVLLGLAVVLFVVDREMLDFTAIQGVNFGSVLLGIFWIVLVVEMIFRLIPNKRVAMGARKHFAYSYSPVQKSTSPLPHGLHQGAFLSALAWFVITGVGLLVLFLLELLSPQIVFIIAIAYAVVDLVFILFFCPFQKLFMKNFCCVDCRIYNWDYFMMCAPLILFPSMFSVSLFVLAVAVLLRWEISIRKNPHFFVRATNKSLHCSSCKDKLCKLKRKEGF